MLALLNPEPEMLSVNAAEPAVSFVGLIELIAGAGTGVDAVPPFPVEGVLFEHPAKQPKRIRLKEKTERRNEANTKRDDTERGTGDRLSMQHF